MIRNLLEKDIFSLFYKSTLSSDENVNTTTVEQTTSAILEHYYHLMEGDLNAVTSILVSTTSLADRVQAARTRFLR